MRHILFVLAMLFLWLPVNGCSGPEKEDSKMVEGTWLPVDAELGGQKFPDEVLKTFKLTITDGKYTVNVGEQIDKGTIKLEPATKPKAIDITGTEGPNKGKTILAIYDLTVDALRICYDLEGKQRPTEFKTVKDTQQFLVNYKRMKS
ncbi:TIGR03067 domain-containing protein [candidate division KSB1 bacterium]|nr:TIGR03067 domain-containing protein [candidate division KSB1 bacterium]